MYFYFFFSFLTTVFGLKSHMLQNPPLTNQVRVSDLLLIESPKKKRERKENKPLTSNAQKNMEYDDDGSHVKTSKSIF